MLSSSPVPAATVGGHRAYAKQDSVEDRGAVDARRRQCVPVSKRRRTGHHAVSPSTPGYGVWYGVTVQLTAGGYGQSVVAPVLAATGLFVIR